MRIRALIVEDEPLARQALRDLVEEVDWLDLVGEAADGGSAVDAIDALKPDLVFLDVKLPEISGLDVLERIRHAPAVIFTTAFDEFAVPAFEFEAVDYLVKPFGRKRFLAAVGRLRRRLEGERPAPASPEGVRAVLAAGPARRLFARDGDRFVPIAVESVSRIEARDDYAAVYSAGRTFLLHVSLGELETRLDRERFLRIHRSHIVNLDYVDLIRPFDERRLLVVLKDGTKVLASRAGSHLLRGLVE
jgi:two-component system LytT family response regulator